MLATSVSGICTPRAAEALSLSPLPVVRITTTASGSRFGCRFLKTGKGRCTRPVREQPGGAGKI